MSQYDAWTQEQLKDELGKRGLPVSGTKPEQIARLEEADADPLGGGNGADSAKLTETSQVDKTPAAVEPSEPAEPEKTFRASYECHGELSTGVHHDNLQRCYSDALAAGKSPRGGAARVAFENAADGKRYAVYEINLRR